jgi:hypothetical protein
MASKVGRVCLLFALEGRNSQVSCTRPRDLYHKSVNIYAKIHFFCENGKKPFGFSVRCVCQCVALVGGVAVTGSS